MRKSISNRKIKRLHHAGASNLTIGGSIPIERAKTTVQSIVLPDFSLFQGIFGHSSPISPYAKNYAICNTAEMRPKEAGGAMHFLAHSAHRLPASISLPYAIPLPFATRFLEGRLPLGVSQGADHSSLDALPKELLSGSSTKQ